MHFILVNVTIFFDEFIKDFIHLTIVNENGIHVNDKYNRNLTFRVTYPARCQLVPVCIQVDNGGPRGLSFNVLKMFMSKHGFNFE